MLNQRSHSFIFAFRNSLLIALFAMALIITTSDEASAMARIKRAVQELKRNPKPTPPPANPTLAPPNDGQPFAEHFLSSGEMDLPWQRILSDLNVKETTRLETALGKGGRQFVQARSEPSVLVEVDGNKMSLREAAANLVKSSQQREAEVKALTAELKQLPWRANTKRKTQIASLEERITALKTAGENDQKTIQLLRQQSKDSNQGIDNRLGNLLDQGSKNLSSLKKEFETEKKRTLWSRLRGSVIGGTTIGVVGGALATWLTFASKSHYPIKSALTLDGTRLAVVSVDSGSARYNYSLRVIDTKTKELIKNVELDTDGSYSAERISDLAISPNGDVAAVQFDDRMIAVNLRSGEQKSLELPSTSASSKPVFSDDGNTIFILRYQLSDGLNYNNPEGNTLVMIDARTGRLNSIKIIFPNSESTTRLSEIRSKGDVVYVAVANKMILKINTKQTEYGNRIVLNSTGDTIRADQQLKWSLPGLVDFQPSSDGKSLDVRTWNQYFSFDTATGEKTSEKAVGVKLADFDPGKGANKNYQVMIDPVSDMSWEFSCADQLGQITGFGIKDDLKRRNTTGSIVLAGGCSNSKAQLISSANRETLAVSFGNVLIMARNMHTDYFADLNVYADTQVSLASKRNAGVHLSPDGSTAYAVSRDGDEGYSDGGFVESFDVKTGDKLWSMKVD